MKKTVLFLVLFCLSLAVVRAQSSKTLDLERITQIVDDYVKEQNIPSVVVGIVQDGQLAHVISRGEKKRESGIAVDAGTGYQIASLTKSFTGIILNSLVEEGQLDLGRSVASYLKGDIPETALTKFEAITLIDVLHHRAALPNNGASVPPTPNGIAMLGGYTQEGFIKDLTEMEIDESKIGQFAYSNFGFGLLGHIAEKVSGKTYEELLSLYITGPNGMDFTTSDLSPETRAKLATPYMVGGDRTRETTPWEMGKVIPAGGILSNVNDLSKLMIREMQAYKAYKAKGEISPYVLTANAKRLNDQMDYGYGFFESRNSFDTTVVQLGHGGDVDGYGSHFEFYPAHDLGLIMLTASGAGGFNEVKSMVERVMLGIPLPKEIELTKDVVKRYTGKYEFDSGTVMTLFRRGNQLKCHVRNWGSASTLYAENETRFNWRGRNAQFEFETDEKGKMTRAIYIENGKKYYPKKIK